MDITNASEITIDDLEITGNATGINEVENNNKFIISSNPSAGNFIVFFSKQVNKDSIEILNTLGANVYTENILYESKKEIKLENISSGVYFVKVFDGEKSYCKKLIIEHN